MQNSYTNHLYGNVGRSVVTIWVTLAFLDSLTSHLHSTQTVVAETVKEQPVQTVQEEKPGVHRVIDVFRYSMLAKLFGITAYVLRFVRNLRKLTRLGKGPLSAKERQEALHTWIKACQAAIYPNEIANFASSANTRLPSAIPWF